MNINRYQEFVRLLAHIPLQAFTVSQAAAWVSQHSAVPFSRQTTKKYLSNLVNSGVLIKIGRSYQGVS